MWVISRCILTFYKLGQCCPCHNDIQSRPRALIESNLVIFVDVSLSRHGTRRAQHARIKSQMVMSLGGWRAVLPGQIEGWHLQSWLSSEVLAPHKADQAVQLQQKEHPCGAQPRSALQFWQERARWGRMPIRLRGEWLVMRQESLRELEKWHCIF